MNSDKTTASAASETSAPLAIGWAEADITPVGHAVMLAGQFYARLSEGVGDPLKASACVLERNGEAVVFVCCDLVSISLELRDSVRAILAQSASGPDPMKVVFHATHSHTAPEVRTASSTAGHTSVGGNCVDLGEWPAEEYLAFAAARIADCVERAWEARAPGGISFGLDYAVVGRNRRWVDSKGVSTMYGLSGPGSEEFRHIEGYEDHSLNLLATYDVKGGLTGLIVNIPSPSQEEMHGLLLSADFWYETRRELRRRFGEHLFIHPQVSAAGELTSELIYERKAHQRMLELRGRTGRQEVANRIADAVGRVLPYLDKAIDRTPVLQHRVEIVEIPANRLTQADVDEAGEAAERLRLDYERELKKLEAEPELKSQPRWYFPVTRAYRQMKWNLGVVGRYERQKTNSFYAEEIHIVRLGGIAFATNPFEYYVDFGVQIKVRSPAIQTFLVQLAGQGTYVPSPRSVMGGGYGSVPASNPVGPEGGQVLAENTVRLLRSLWEEKTGG